VKEEAMTEATAARLTMSLGQAIFSMRAIRRVRPDPIPQDDLHVMLEAAIHAPNGGNRQPWRFIVITDPDIRARFAPLYREAWWAKRKDEGINGPEDIPPGHSLRPAMRLADEIGSTPVIVLVCSTSRGLGPMTSVIPAVENLLLAGRSLGVGGTITTLHAVVEERVHDLLGIPPTAQVVYCLPLGYPRGRFGPTTRKPLAEVCAFQGWNGSVPWD